MTAENLQRHGIMGRKRLSFVLILPSTKEPGDDPFDTGPTPCAWCVEWPLRFSWYVSNSSLWSSDMDSTRYTR